MNQGQYIKLTCNATGAIRAPLEVDWFFYGERIISTQKRWRDRTRILKRTKDRSFISDLIVERSTLEDNGNYVCRSTDVGPVYEVTSIFVNVLSGKLVSSTLKFYSQKNLNYRLDSHES